eukprot:3409337-Pyramimonas_sp.AAC.1
MSANYRGIVIKPRQNDIVDYVLSGNRIKSAPISRRCVDVRAAENRAHQMKIARSSATRWPN